MVSLDSQVQRSTIHGHLVVELLFGSVRSHHKSERGNGAQGVGAEEPVNEDCMIDQEGVFQARVHSVDSESVVQAAVCVGHQLHRFLATDLKRDSWREGVDIPQSECSYVDCLGHRHGSAYNNFL